MKRIYGLSEKGSRLEGSIILESFATAQIYYTINMES